MASSTTEVVKGTRAKKIIRSEPLDNATYAKATWNDNAAFIYGVPRANVYWDRFFEPHNLYHNVEVLDGELRASPALAMAVAQTQLKGKSVLNLLSPEEKVRRAIGGLFGNLLKSGMFGAKSVEYIGEVGSSTWQCFPKVFMMPTVDLFLTKRLDGSSGPPMSLSRTELEPRPNVRDQWRLHLGLANDTQGWPKDGKTTVVIANRLKNRRIINVKEVEAALRSRGWKVKVVAFEGMSVDEQFTAIQDATTYIGAHGAGLRWGQYLHPRAAMMQLVGFPCAIEVQTKMGFRPRYAVIRSLLPNITTDADFARADRWCKLLSRHQIGTKFPPLSVKDAAALGEWKRDVRLYDVNVDIAMLIRAVEMLDPVQAPDAKVGDFVHEYQHWNPINVRAGQGKRRKGERLAYLKTAGLTLRETSHPGSVPSSD